MLFEIKNFSRLIQKILYAYAVMFLTTLWIYLWNYTITYWYTVHRIKNYLHMRISLALFDFQILLILIQSVWWSRITSIYVAETSWITHPYLEYMQRQFYFPKNKSIPQFQHHFSKVWFYNMTEHLNFFHQHQLNLSHSLLNVYFWHNTLHYFCRCNLYVIALSMLC